MIILTSRQAHLLKLLNAEEDYRTTSYFAKQMGVSGRTVHSDLLIIEDYLATKRNVIIEKKRGTGIRLDGNQNEKLKLIAAISSENCVNVGSTRERRESIIARLLRNESATNFRKLAEHFYVGISSITNDMQKVEHWLSRFGLILNKNNHGTSISGTESSIRKALASLIQEKINRITDSVELGKNVGTEKKKQIIDIITLFLAKDSLDQAEKMIYFIEKELNCHFNNIYYVNMIIYVAIMMERQAKGKYLRQNAAEEHLINNLHILKTYIVAKETLIKFCKLTESDALEGEVQYLNHCIMGSGIDEDIGKENIRKYAPEVQQLARKLCLLASDALKVDFDGDSILYKGLLVHLGPMLNRMKYGIVIRNPLLKQIKEQYSAMFGLATFLGTFIENETNLKINENEIGFLMVHFQAALERNGATTKIIIVCPGGIGTSELIANRVRRLMPNLDIFGVYSIRDIGHANIDEIDFIVSTVPLKNMRKPSIIVSPMMGISDVKAINNFYLEYMFKNKKAISYFNHLSAVVKDEFIFPKLNIDDKNDLIDFITKRIEDKGFVSSKFADSVKERERISTTDLGNGVAIPHGQGRYVNQSVIAIATLSIPIDWGKNKVSVVILIAMRINDKKETKSIMGDLYNLFDSESILERIVKANSKAKIRNILGK